MQILLQSGHLLWLLILSLCHKDYLSSILSTALLFPQILYSLGRTEIWMIPALFLHSWWWFRCCRTAGWKLSLAFRHNKQSVILWGVFSSANFFWQKSPWWRTNICGFSPYLFSEWGKSTGGQKLCCSDDSADSDESHQLQRRGNSSVTAITFPCCQNSYCHLLYRSKKKCTFSMGILCLWKTFRKFLDNGNISNLWRIHFPQLLSPSTWIDKLSFIMTSTDQSKPQFFIFLNAINFFSHYALFENKNYSLSLKDNSHFISSLYKFYY